MIATSEELTQAFNNLNIELDTHQLEYLEGENLKINCTNSSDFIVGKQTTFNGPVTIINCDSPENLTENKKETDCEERVVIRDKVLTQSATNTVQSKAVKDYDKTADNFLKQKKVRAIEFLTRDFLKIPVGAWIIMFALLFGAIIAVGVYSFEKETENVMEIRQPQKIVASNGESFNFFTKQGWGGLNASSTVKITLPIPYVIISHTAGGTCYEKKTCMEYLRNIQKDQMSRTPAYADIAYNFLVGGDGNIYEGRGWTNRSPIDGFANNKNIDINFIGDFSVDRDPTKPQIEAVKALIEYGLNNSFIAENYSLIATNSTGSTLSLGRNVYKIIKTWPHFDPEPEKHLLE